MSHESFTKGARGRGSVSNCDVGKMASKRPFLIATNLGANGNRLLGRLVRSSKAGSGASAPSGRFVTRSDTSRNGGSATGERSASPNYLFFSKQGISGRRTTADWATRRVFFHLQRKKS